MKTSPVLTSVTRIVTATVVGFVLNLPLTPQVLDFFNATSDQAIGWLGAGTALVVSSVYYGVVRWLEEHKNAALGWLLGVAARPRYDAPTPLSDES
jgi:hypothetical protein